MRSWKTPTPEQVSKALALLGHAEQYRYFFDRLENPLWIGPLREHKFFQNPAAIIHDEERGIIIFDERGLWHEYIGLVHDHFDALTPEQQAQFLNWIETERTPESVKATHERWDGTVLSVEEADKQA